MNNISDQRLKTLFNACFDKRREISLEARHLARFFLEYKLINHSSEQEEQYKAELSENEVFRSECGELHLYDGEFNTSEITGFVQCLVQNFLDKPKARSWLAQVLKQSGSINGTQDAIANFIQKDWSLDEGVTDRTLDIIWDLKVLVKLETTLNEIVEVAKDEVLRDHASQLLRMLQESSEKGPAPLKK